MSIERGGLNVRLGTYISSYSRLGLLIVLIIYEGQHGTALFVCI